MNNAAQTECGIVNQQTSVQWQCILAFGIEESCKQPAGASTNARQTTFEVMP